MDALFNPQTTEALVSAQELALGEKVLLQWLVDAGAPVSPVDLLRRPRPEGLSPLAIRNAIWNLVDSGVARITPGRLLEATGVPRV